MATVSIIVPVYNAEKYLNKCIERLTSQSFDDFELILVNDGSKDRSGEICDEYAKNDSRIRVIHKENGGVSSARNAGLDAAQGRYIMFCDSDDFIEPDFCAPLVELSQGDENCLVFAGISTINDKGITRPVLCEDYPEGAKEVFTKQQFCDLYVKWNLKKTFTLMHMPYNKLFSRKVIEENNIRYDTNIHYNEDLIFNLEYLDVVDCVKLYNSPVYNYYVDAPGSLCKKYFPNLLDMLKVKMSKLKSIILDKAADKEGAHRVWCTMVFNDYNRTINNTFSAANPQSKRAKTRYCTKLIRSKEFCTALKGADTSSYNKRYIKLLKLKHFGLIQFIKKLT